ncbi:hypothetical protein [Stakelama pacifica]|uniref:Uncharacterized protein n=1 Tax=Stakelama pacifica TaxID=517720 RepID=A0A4R6FJG8_9SPHN|nr:hypothetical protein [Stakelama pacifica]TDN80684.1 hypothetical protein EV664_10974 [Stakelama pacifica]GGO97450.1 hypothetical protein GCM10011329_26340 [Stakelama pacifica]
MAYREKLAWLTLAVMLMTYSVYFLMVALWIAPAPPQGAAMLHMLVLFAGVTVVQAVLVAIGAALLAVRARADGEERADERDRAIARRGTHIAYYVLMTGMVLVGLVMPFGEARWKIVNAALLALVLAEATRHAVVVLSYKRGWHG